MTDSSHDFIKLTYLEVGPNGGVRCTCTAIPPLSSNGTHIFDEAYSVTIACEILYTTCSKYQELYTL